MAYDPKALPQPLKQWYRKIGKKGGAARQQQLTPEERRDLARKAATERWRSKRESGLKVLRRNHRRYCAKHRSKSVILISADLLSASRLLTQQIEALHAPNIFIF